jgi:AcrR family transcriptional regulator
VPVVRRYDTLLAKGEDRKQRILDVAQRLLMRNGWRNTTLAQIAGEAGVTPAGLLHHFAPKEQVLHAVLDARDPDDASHADRPGDLLVEIARVADRFDRAPQMLGTFTVLLVENILPDAPLHDRMLDRQRQAIDIVAELIRLGQAGWLFDRSMAGWDVTVLLTDLAACPDLRPLQIIGVHTLDLEDALGAVESRPHPQALAAAADLFGCDSRVRQGVLQALDHGVTEVTLWGRAGRPSWTTALACYNTG